MKRIFKTAFVLLLIMAFAVSLQAATKTVTQHTRAAQGSGLNQGGFKIIPGLGPVRTSDPGTPITVDLSDPQKLKLGNGDRNNTAGCVWYQGSNRYCDNGVCKFENGLRVFFQFKILTTDATSNSKGYADGFVFAVLNAALNTSGGVPDRSGGAYEDVIGVASGSGELLGYAGPGNTGRTGAGLRPPKMAVEFDTFPNHDDDEVCNEDSRNDGSSNRNHVALVFWGDSPTGYCSNITGNIGLKESFDDNRHGAGTGGNPRNSAPGDSGYYEGPSAKVGSYQWLENGVNASDWNDGRHFARIEIDRSTNTDGTGKYIFRVWIDCGGSTCNFTSQSYSGNTTVSNLSKVHKSLKDIDLNLYNNPQILRTVQFSKADHDAMDPMVFGFCEATGNYAPQDIVLKDITGYFPPRGSTITWTVTPSVAPAANLGTITPGGPQTVNDGATTQFVVAARNDTDFVSKFVSITGCGGTLSGATYTTGLVTGDCDVVATFIRRWKVEASASGGGTITPIPAAALPLWVDNNSTLQFRVKPNAGSKLTSVSGCGGMLSGTTYTTGNVTGSCTVTANFTPCTLNIAAGWACRPSSGATRLFMKPYITDGAGNPVINANVSWQAWYTVGINYYRNGSLTNLGNGYYGGNVNGNCGAGGPNWEAVPDLGILPTIKAQINASSTDATTCNGLPCACSATQVGPTNFSR